MHPPNSCKTTCQDPSPKVIAAQSYVIKVDFHTLGALEVVALEVARSRSSTVVVAVVVVVVVVLLVLALEVVGCRSSSL